MNSGTITKVVLVCFALGGAAAGRIFLRSGGEPGRGTFAPGDAGNSKAQRKTTSVSDRLGIDRPASSNAEGPDAAVSSLNGHDNNTQISLAAGHTGFSRKIDVSMTVLPPGSNISTATWQNSPLGAQSRRFEVTFDAVPNAANIDGVTVLSAGPLAVEAGLNAAIATDLPLYACVWSPAVGLSCATGGNPAAWPGRTTAYTVTVPDASGTIAKDTAVVTVGVAAGGPVHYVSNTGDDGNNGSAAAPWKTLGKACNVATAGATVIVRSGTYHEALRPANSGSDGSPITFRSEVKGGAILDGQKTRSYGVDVTRSSSYIRVDGFEIRNHTADGVALNDWYSRTTRGIQVVNCYIHDNAGDGLNFRNSQDSLVEGNDITNNGQTGVAIGGKYGSTNLVVRSNTIHHNVKDGVQGNCTNLVAEYNTMYDEFFSDAHQDGFQLDGYNNATIRYNLIGDFTQLIYGGPSTGDVGTCKDLKVYGNVFYNSGYWRVGGPNGAGGTCPAVFIDSTPGAAGSVVTGVQIYNNTFLYLGDKQKPILLYGNARTTMSDVRIYNNIFYQCRGAQGGNTYDIDSRFTSVRCDYNCYYNMLPMSRQDAHSIVANPKFVNYTPGSQAFDVHLRAGSPCINAGAANLASLVDLPSPCLDVDGNWWPGGGNYDIGADEAP